VKNQISSVENMILYFNFDFIFTSIFIQETKAHFDQDEYNYHDENDARESDNDGEVDEDEFDRDEFEGVESKKREEFWKPPIIDSKIESSN
jgi:hypothetical protein